MRGGGGAPIYRISGMQCMHPAVRKRYEPNARTSSRTCACGHWFALAGTGASTSGTDMELVLLWAETDTVELKPG